MRYLAFLTLMLLIPISLLAREGRDTLVTRTGDTFIIPYDVAISGNNVTVTMRPAIKRLGQTLAKKYRKPEELTLVFFDRNGSFQDAVFSGDVSPEAFMVPADTKYSASPDGFFILHDNPAITFVASDIAHGLSLSIPLFLVHHPTRGKYTLVARCGNLRIEASKPVDRGQRNIGSSEPESRIITSTVEVESDNTDVTNILDCIANINARLPFEDRLPFSESLEGDVSLLRQWKYSVKDRNVKAKVTETLDAYENRKRALQDAEDAKKLAAQLNAAEEQRRVQEEAVAREEAAEAARKEEQEKAQKRNLWMIIGGVFAAVGAFIGNQALQNKRNVKNQKNIMQMQQSITQQAESAAKRRAQSLVRSKTSQAIGQAKSNARGAIREGVGNVGKSIGNAVGKSGKKKNFSI